MNRRINPHRPSGAHTEADAANARLNPVAAFRTLLQKMGRPAVLSEKDKKARRGSGSAGGPARSRGGLLNTETDDAVEDSTAGGDGGREGNEGHAAPGDGGAGEAILEGPSFSSALETATEAESPDPDLVSLLRPSPPPVWPIAALRASWTLSDPPLLPYDARPAGPARADGVRAPFRRWARAASVQPYAPPSVAVADVPSRYRPFVPALHTSTVIVPALPRGTAVRWRPLATPLTPFVPSNTSMSAPRRGAGYRPFTPPPRSAQNVASPAARYSPFTPLMAPPARAGQAPPRIFGLENRVVAPTRPYALPGPFAEAGTRAVERRSYKPPPRPIGGIEVARPPGLATGDGRRPPMSIDTLLARLGGGAGSIAAGSGKVARAH